MAFKLVKGSCNSATRKHTVFARFGSSNWHCLVFWHSACRLRVSSQILGKSGSVEYWWWFGPEVLVTEDDHAGGKVSANSDHKENAESWILFFFPPGNCWKSNDFGPPGKCVKSDIVFCLLGQFRKSNNVFLSSRKMLKFKNLFGFQEDV